MKIDKYNVIYFINYIINEVADEKIIENAKNILGDKMVNEMQNEEWKKYL